MKSYAHLFAKLFASPLMLHGPVRMAFEDHLIARMRGETPTVPAAALATSANVANDANLSLSRADLGEPGRVDEEWIAYARDMKATQKILRLERVYQRFGDVAVISIHGVIDKIISQFEMDCYGGVDLADIDQALSIAAGDPRVSKVVLNIDSPGGSVIGVEDTARRIAALRESKEVHAYIPAMAASAGYYIASQADKITAGSSAIIGSIGVYCAILDASRWYQKEGLEMQVLKAGDYKTMGAQWRPLTDEEKAFLQAGVDRNYAAFKSAVTALREVDDSTMQGQWWPGEEAQKLNLVDETTGATLDEFVSGLLLS